MEPPSIKEIDEAADEYVRVRNARMRATEREVERRDILEALMKKHELKSYEFEDKRVELAVTEKVKVKKVGEDTDLATDEE